MGDFQVTGALSQSMMEGARQSRQGPWSPMISWVPWAVDVKLGRLRNTMKSLIALKSARPIKSTYEVGVSPNGFAPKPAYPSTVLDITPRFLRGMPGISQPRREARHKLASGAQPLHRVSRETCRPRHGRCLPEIDADRHQVTIGPLLWYPFLMLFTRPPVLFLRERRGPGGMAPVLAVSATEKTAGGLPRLPTGGVVFPGGLTGDQQGVACPLPSTLVPLAEGGADV